MGRLVIKKAERKKVAIKAGFTGPSGSGKTLSALLCAYGIVGDWSKIGVIDTENDSASLYSHLGDFNTIDLTPPYSPEKYIEAIGMFEDDGSKLIIIDSISHEWEGTGGCLEIYEGLGGSYRDWAKVTPKHRRFTDKILQSKCHIFTTARKKQTYEQVKEDNKWKVKKLGTKEVTRDGWEYELTINFDIESDTNLAHISKNRTGLFKDLRFVITEDTGKELKDWCESGKSVEEIREEEESRRASEIDDACLEMEACSSKEEGGAVWSAYNHLQTVKKFVEARDELKRQLELSAQA